jgi:DNA polymerase
MMLVGEQPGDQEDKRGTPFVGPAGRILDEALEAAGIRRDDVYVTNIVKHFKWRPVGKRRLHAKPTNIEVSACRPWFERELEIVDPDALVILGATAAKALLGPAFRVTATHGERVPSDFAPVVTATIHPSAVLRAGDDRAEAMKMLVEDLRSALDALHSLSEKA